MPLCWLPTPCVSSYHTQCVCMAFSHARPDKTIGARHAEPLNKLLAVANVVLDNKRRTVPSNGGCARRQTVWRLFRPFPIPPALFLCSAGQKRYTSLLLPFPTLVNRHRAADGLTERVTWTTVRRKEPTPWTSADVAEPTQRDYHYGQR